MSSVGPGELIVVLIIALLVLGPSKLPEAGKSIGKGIREFRDAVSGKTDDEDQIGRHPHDPPIPRG